MSDEQTNDPRVVLANMSVLELVEESVIEAKRYREQLQLAQANYEKLYREKDVIREDFILLLRRCFPTLDLTTFLNSSHLEQIYMLQKWLDVERTKTLLNQLALVEKSWRSDLSEAVKAIHGENSEMQDMIANLVPSENEVLSKALVSKLSSTGKKYVEKRRDAAERALLAVILDVWTGGNNIENLFDIETKRKLAIAFKAGWRPTNAGLLAVLKEWDELFVADGPVVESNSEA